MGRAQCMYRGCRTESGYELTAKPDHEVKEEHKVLKFCGTHRRHYRDESLPNSFRDDYGADMTSYDEKCYRQCKKPGCERHFVPNCGGYCGQHTEAPKTGNCHGEGCAVTGASFALTPFSEEATIENAHWAWCNTCKVEGAVSKDLPQSTELKKELEDMQLKLRTHYPHNIKEISEKEWTAFGELFKNEWKETYMHRLGLGDKPLGENITEEHQVVDYLDERVKYLQYIAAQEKHRFVGFTLWEKDEKNNETMMAARFLKAMPDDILTSAPDDVKDDSIEEIFQDPDFVDEVRGRIERGLLARPGNNGNKSFSLLLVLQGAIRGSNDPNEDKLKKQGEEGIRAQEKIARIQQIMRGAAAKVRRQRENLVLFYGYRAKKGEVDKDEVQVQGSRGYWYVSYRIFDGIEKKDKSGGRRSRSISRPRSTSKSQRTESEDAQKQKGTLVAKGQTVNEDPAAAMEGTAPEEEADDEDVLMNPAFQEFLLQLANENHSSDESPGSGCAHT